MHPKPKSRHFIQSRNEQKYMKIGKSTIASADLNRAITVVDTSVKNICKHRKDPNEIPTLRLMDIHKAHTPNQQNGFYFETQNIHVAGAQMSHLPNTSKTMNIEDHLADNAMNKEIKTF